MDASLQVLIAGTAVYGGAVAHLVLVRRLGHRRAALAAAGTAAAVAAGFLFAIYLATVALPAVFGFVALVAGGTTYLSFRGDLGPRRAAVTGACAAAVVTVSFQAVLYLALIAFIAGIGVYHLVRTRYRIRPAMIMMGSTVSGLLAAAGLAFWVSLTYVM